MKYLILVPDGCADRPVQALGGKTPLEVADMKHINALARIAEVGSVRTIPDGMTPGSDAANLSVMGFDPARYLTGRSPLEAVSMGIDMSDTDVAFRTNLVTLEGEGAYEDLIIKDHSAGDISSEEGRALIELVDARLGGGSVRFYPGVSYRHAMIVDRGKTHCELMPPHDILTRRVGDYLPRGEGAEEIERLMRASHALLKDHPVNRKRMAEGRNPANSIWIWGQGKKPMLPSFYAQYGIRGSIVAAVDLIKGIGLCAGLDAPSIEGATGTLLTNFAGKAEGAIAEFRSGKDFVYIHVEAPDECGHQGDLAGKIESLRLTDEKIFGPVLAYLETCGEPYRILTVPDHRTPIELRTHSSEPVPYVLFDSEHPQAPSADKAFTEAAGAAGPHFESGCALANRFFGGG
jgi:2,3-bisphosphoglycerate-independent phosphoglycerate mutase